MAIRVRNTGSTQLVSRDELHEESRGIREDFIVIFGLFASFLIFLGIEVQVLQKAPRFSMLVGLSCFMLGAVLAFALAMHGIVKGKDRINDYIANPLAYFVIACFIGAAICFAWGVFHKSDTSNKSTQSSNSMILPVQ